MHRNDSSVGGVEIVVGGAARESDECGGGAACGVEAWEHGGTESGASVLYPAREPLRNMDRAPH